MGYIGKVPADVLIDPHVDSASIVDSTIVTADIANDAVTSAKLAQNSVDSSELIDGSVDNSHLAGSIAINKTLLSAGTGITLATNTLNVDAAQTQITSVGTLGSLTTSGDVNVTADGARFFVSSADYELVSIGRAGSSGSALDQGYFRMKSAGSNKIALHTASDSYIAGGGLSVNTTSLLESTYTQFEVKQSSDATGIALTSGNTNASARNWGLFTNYSAWGSLDFRYSSGTDNTPRTNLALALTKDGNATFTGDVTIGDKILYTASDYLKVAISGTDRFWISDATDNWGLNFTGASPYGMQITTTASDSSSHDVFKIKRGNGDTIFDIYGDGNVYIPQGNLTTTGTILIQGNANYLGLEVKGVGGSRPQVKWSNVNNGVMGSIYGTESNGLVIGSGTSNVTAMTISSAQEISLAVGVKFEANSGSTKAKLHWHHFKTTLGRRYYHFHTNISWGTAAQMYSIQFNGMAYNSGVPINTRLVFYNYDNGSVLNTGYSGNHPATVYESSSNKIVLQLDLGAGHTYYSGLTISSYHTAQGVADFSITEQGVSNSATGVY